MRVDMIKVCTLTISDKVPSHADPMWEILLRYLEGSLPYELLTHLYQTNSNYISFLECIQ